MNKGKKYLVSAYEKITVDCIQWEVQAGNEEDACEAIDDWLPEGIHYEIDAMEIGEQDGK